MHEMTNSVLLGRYSLEPAISAIVGATQWLETLAEQYGWSPRAQYGLTLSVDETLTNIVSYGFGDRVAAQPILLTCYQSGDDVLVRIEDMGVAFDPTVRGPEDLDALLPSLEGAQLGGHGLRLMQHFLSEIDYQRQDGRNVLTLRIPTNASS